MLYNMASVGEKVSQNISDMVNSALNKKKEPTVGLAPVQEEPGYPEGVGDDEEEEFDIMDDLDLDEFEEAERNAILTERYKILAMNPDNVQFMLNPENPDKLCRNCSSFVIRTQDIVMKFLEDRVPFIDGATYGECRCNPPVTNQLEGGIAEFPVVPHIFWCRKWALAPRPISAAPAPQHAPEPEDITEE
jgi:hypothetical protein